MNFKRATWILLAVFAALQIALMPFIESNLDDPYYAVWAQRLDWSYFDHPPMIAWLARAMGGGIQGTRLAALATLLITMIFMVKTMRVFKASDKSVFYTLLAFSACPTVFVRNTMNPTPERPFLMFFAIAFYAFAKLYTTDNRKWWYAIGTAAGLACLSKYTGALIYLSLLVALVADRKLREQWQHKELYLGAALSTVFLLPILVFNIRIEFAPFMLHLNRTETFGFKWYRALSFFPEQLVVLTPLYFYLLIRALKRNWANARPMVWFFLPTMTFWSILAFRVMVGSTWAFSAYLPLFVLYASTRQDKPTMLEKVALCLAVISTIMYIYYKTNMRVEKNLDLSDKVWSLAANRIAIEQDALGKSWELASNSYGLVARIKLRLPEREVYSLTKHPDEFNQVWHRDINLQGKNFLYITPKGGSFADPIKRIDAREIKPYRTIIVPYRGLKQYIELYKIEGYESLK